jgi:hypothetical protein
LAVSSPALAQGETQTQQVIPVVPPPTSGTPPWMSAWIGGSFTNHFDGGYAGFTTATNPQKSLYADTWMVRMDFFGGRYDSSIFNGVTNQDQDVWMHGADFLVGYKWVQPSWSFSLYAGPSYEFHNNKDPNATIHGGEAGAKIVLEHYWNINPLWNLSTGGAFATAFTSWYAYSQLAYAVSPNLKIGPEVIVFGNEAPYKEYRVGGFVRFPTGFGELTVSGGFLDPITDGQSGWYASVLLSRNFDQFLRPL